jgi:hypothetical protein
MVALGRVTTHSPVVGIEPGKPEMLEIHNIIKR